MADLRILPADIAPRALQPLRLPALSPEGETFGAALTSAIGHVNAAQNEAEAVATAMAAGQAEDTAASIAAIEKASITFQLALQIRNKLLEAYQDIMRMPV
jgi:flagellar hook-basal body complex protein FliE